MSPGWAVLVLLLGLMLRVRTTVVVLLAAAVAALGTGQSVGQLLNTLGKAFVDNRTLTLFLLTLPAVATAERYGLREWVTHWVRRRSRGRSPAHLLSGYQCFRVLCGILGLRLNGHPTLVRPLLAPMACAQAPPASQEVVKAASAAAENYGNFYGQNLSPVGGGVLMVYGLLQGMGWQVSLWRLVAFAAFPALLSVALGWMQFRKIPSR
jgi:uncharacterized membrane protein